MNLAESIESALDQLISQKTLLKTIPDQSLEFSALCKISESTIAHLIFLSEQASKMRNPFSEIRRARCIQKISYLEGENLDFLKKIIYKKPFNLRKRRLIKNKIAV